MRRRNMRSKQSLQEFMGRLTGRQHPTRAWRQPSDGFCRHRSKSLNLRHLSTVSMDKAVELQTQTTCGPRGSRIRRGPGFQKQLMGRTRNCRDDLGQARMAR